jgi:lipoate-protein ligase A
MIYIKTNSNDPTWNLTMEEYIQKELLQFDHILMLWQNKNSVIIGRYQNTLREVNQDVSRAHDIKVVRRDTSGGAVYHDLGNLNYSFITPCHNPENLSLAETTLPMIQALEKLGIHAEASGRNDILLNGRKISGTAQSLWKNRLLHHGTLLYNADMSILQEVLNVDETKLISKGVTSVKGRVTNISEEMKWDDNINEFWHLLVDQLNIVEEYELSKEEFLAVEKLKKEKYDTWEWNVGNEPAFAITKEKRFSGGLLTTSLNVKKGKITQCSISGDFLGLVDIGDLVNRSSG